MRPAGSRATARMAALGLTSALALGGCEAILGTGSLSDRPSDGGTGDGTVGGDTGVDAGEDALTHETGADSGTDATSPDGGADVTVGDATGADTGEAAPSEAGTESGADGTALDGNVPETGVPETGPEAAPTLSCAMVLADQRQVNAAGATISADGLVVFNTSQTNVLAIARTSVAPAIAYSMRSDRPGDAPTVIPLQSLAASPSPLDGVARSVTNDETYVLGNDQSNNSLIWNWLDSTGIGGAPSGAASRSPVPGGGQMVATSQGIFYAVTDNSGAYADFQVPPALPSVVAGNQITTVPNGMTDGQRAYRLSDNRVSLVYTGADGAQHQNEYAANSTTLVSTRTYYADGMIPYGFQADGSNVDVTAVLFPPDASAPGIATASIPESQLFTFDPSVSLKTVALPEEPSNTGCVATYPGKFVLLAPTTAGMDLLIMDVATSTLSYSLTGTANLVHGDTAIVNCAVSAPVVSGNTMTFEVIWTDNTGSGSQNLQFAPMQCTLQ